MSRKAKATSIDGTLIAFGAAGLPGPEPPYRLNRRARRAFDEIVLRRARDEWQPVDLRFAAELAGVLVALHDEGRRLTREGLVIEGERGSRKNPRLVAVEALARRSVALARYLRVHPASEGREPSLVRSGRQVEREARETLAAASPARPNGGTLSARRRAKLLLAR